MEQLDYLIRTLTYKRSSLELMLKQEHSDEFYSHVKDEIKGLNIAITEIYKLILGL